MDVLKKQIEWQKVLTLIKEQSDLGLYNFVRTFSSNT